MNQERNILAPVAKRRDFDRKHIEPVKKVLAKLFVADHVIQITMCSRNQTNIDMNGPCTSQPLELLFLQGAQELRLQIQRDVADLVEK